MYEIISLQDKNAGDTGFLVPIEEMLDIPFFIKRIYYIGGVSASARRGYHAHRNLEQVLICVIGSVKILLDDGNEKKVIELCDPFHALYIKPGLWREMYDFTSESVLLVLASEHYNEEDYIRNYSDFLEWKQGES